MLKTNENVIAWLNKQVTEAQLGHGRPGAAMPGPYDLNSTAAYSARIPPGYSARPMGPGVPGGVPNSAASMQSTPRSVLGAVPPSHTGSSVVAGAPQFQHRQGYHPQVQYQPGAAPNLNRKGNLGQPLAKSSPLNPASIPEERFVSNHASPALMAQTHPSHMPTHSHAGHMPTHSHAGHMTSRPVGDSALDKYLQSTGEVPLRASAQRSTSPAHLSIHFGTNTPPSAPVTAPVPTRAGSAGKPPGSLPNKAPAATQPPLASAYFPGRTKVS